MFERDHSQRFSTFEGKFHSFQGIIDLTKKSNGQQIVKSSTI